MAPSSAVLHLTPAVTIQFTDNTWGVYVSNMAPVPEPASLVALAGSAVLVMALRRGIGSR